MQFDKQPQKLFSALRTPLLSKTLKHLLHFGVGVQIPSPRVVYFVVTL
jgi:hypothetical protein